MDSSGLSLWLISLLFLLLIAAGLGGYYLLLQNWRNRVNQQFHPFSSQLRSLEGRYIRARQAFEGFSSSDPEPYGSLAGAGESRLQNIEATLQGLRDQYFGLQKQVPSQKEGLLDTLDRSPRRLNNLLKEIQKLEQGIAQEGTALAEVDSIVEAINQAGWQEAQGVRRALDVKSKISQAIQTLQAAHCRGPSWQSALQSEKGLRDELQKIPEIFSRDDPSQVIQQASRQDVIEVHLLLGELVPQQQSLSDSLSHWQEQYSDLQIRQDLARQALSRADQSLSNLPVGVDPTAFQQDYDNLEKRYRDIQSLASNPDVDTFSITIGQLDELSQESSALEQALRRSYQTHALLEQSLNDLNNSVRQISTQISNLGTLKSYPVVWGDASNALAKLNQGVTALGPSTKSRTDILIEKDLESARQLVFQMQDLSGYVDQVTEQHSQLVELLNSPQIAQGLLWVQQTQKLAQQFKEYHPDNWLRVDAVNNLPSELQTLAADLQRLGANEPARPIAEQKLPGELDLARQVVQSSQDIRVRVNAIEARLAALQQSETQALESLDIASKGLVQTGYIVRSNALLSGSAAQDVDRLLEQTNRQKADLVQHATGTVDYKSRQASGLYSRVEQAVQTWQERVNSDTQTRVKAMTSALTRLDSIAPLEDPAVIEVNRLLTRGLPRPSGAAAARPASRMDELVLDLKLRSEYQQACSAAQRALEEIEKPVVDSFNTSNQNRLNVQDQVKEVYVWLRQTRAWPPTSVSIDDEQQEFGRLEAEWQAIKGQPHRAIDLVALLGDLSSRYQALGERIRQLAERGSREQDQVTSLEQELDQYNRQWDQRWQEHQTNKLASEEIRELITNTENEQYRIRTQFREGTADYSKTLTSLQSLHRKVRLYQVALDDNHVIDVSGQVITSRDSKRAPGDW